MRLKGSCIQEQINKNHDLCKTAEDFMNSIEIEGESKKAMLFSAFLKISLSHFYAINILVNLELYASAFALVRVFFDSVVRGLYTAYIFDEITVDKIWADEANWKFPNSTKMSKALDSCFNFNEKIFEQSIGNVYNIMCDYIHTGYNQVAYQFDNQNLTIQSDFNVEQVKDTLKANHFYMNFFIEKYKDFIFQYNKQQYTGETKK